MVILYMFSRSKSKEELLNIFPDNYSYIKHIAVDFTVIVKLKVINYILRLIK